MKRLIRWASFGLGVLSLSCGGEAGGDWRGTITDSAGVAMVVNPEVGIWGGASPWSLEQELTIGTAEGDPDYQFGQIGGIAVASDGRILAMDVMGQHIKVFSPEGTFERVIGGPGSGPGEIGAGAIFLFVGEGDTLLVPDLQNQRVNRYDPDGESLSSFPLSLQNGLPMLFQATAAGTIAEQVRPLSLPNRPATDSMDTIVILATDGSVKDTLTRFASGGTLQLGGASPRVELFAAEPVWRVAEGDDLGVRLFFGINDDYRIRVYAPGGRLERVISKPFERAEVSETDREAVFQFLEEAWRGAGLGPEQIQQARSVMAFADHFPAFAAIQEGPRGTIWVQHIQPPSTLSEEERKAFNAMEDIGARGWDVFDEEGRYLGVVEMPPRFAPRTFVKERIYGVWRDDLDVPYLVTMRVTGLGDDRGGMPLGGDR